MTAEYRYVGPDGGGIDALPAGVGAAVGSEYCVHLLPGARELARASAAADARGVPLLLLTPYFRDAELARAIAVFRAIPEGADAVVAVNDWGALLVLRVLFPGLRLTVGRLLSGQKRCPRIDASPRLSAAEKAWHRQGLFSSARARDYLAGSFGVSGYHLDAPAGELPTVAPESPRGPEGGAPGPGTTALLFVHVPYAIVTVSDACPWLGGRSSARVSACPRPCRGGAVLLREAAMGGDLIQKGKARFVHAGSPRPEEAAADPRFRIVRYDDLP